MRQLKGPIRVIRSKFKNWIVSKRRKFGEKYGFSKRSILFGYYWREPWKSRLDHYIGSFLKTGLLLIGLGLSKTVYFILSILCYLESFIVSFVVRPIIRELSRETVEIYYVRGKGICIKRPSMDRMFHPSLRIELSEGTVILDREYLSGSNEKQTLLRFSMTTFDFLHLDISSSSKKGDIVVKIILYGEYPPNYKSLSLGLSNSGRPCISKIISFGDIEINYKK